MMRKETLPVGQKSGGARGAGPGGLTRYVAGTWIMATYGGRFTLGTIINVTGSFLIGVLITLLTERLQPHPNWRRGTLSGYTTFSSFEYESLQAVARAGWVCCT